MALVASVVFIAAGSLPHSQCGAGASRGQIAANEEWATPPCIIHGQALTRMGEVSMETAGQGATVAAGTLFVVATPIGNLDDLSARARRVLAEVDLIAAEDTRHSARLLSHYGIATRCVPLHGHNETRVAPRLVARLLEGSAIALVSDAGTPLLSDPGFELVRAARAAGVAVVPVPGPSALLAALSVAGLPAERFVFEGFLPARSGARRHRLEALRDESRTLVLFEAPHRIEACLADLVDVFGPDRPAAAARELTKIHEEVISGTLAGLAAAFAGASDRRRGEFVLVIGGATVPEDATAAAVDSDRLLRLLVRELPLKKASAIVAEATGQKKNAVYARALALREAGVGRSPC